MTGAASAASASADGTERYRDRFAANTDGSHFSLAGGLWLSSIGLGTYLGEPDEATNTGYRQAVDRAIEVGCNVIDTAANYRYQLSERAIGQALRRSGFPRDEVFVSTKGGYVPYEGALPQDPARYITETFIRTGIAGPEDFAQGGQHCMAPGFLSQQLAQSRVNLALETLDLYYVHNPEGQLGDVSREQFNKRLRAAFEFLEKAVAAGHIRGYGLATWNGFRQLPSAPDYLSLTQVVGLAKEVAGEGHHFKAIQLPINLTMTEALDHKNQPVDGRWLSPIEAARTLGLMVFGSASLLQARLSRNLPSAVRNALGVGLSDAQRALQFVRSLPGLTCALVGMSQIAHVDENLALAKRPRLVGPELERVLG